VAFLRNLRKKKDRTLPRGLEEGTSSTEVVSTEFILELKGLQSGYWERPREEGARELLRCKKRFDGSFRMNQSSAQSGQNKKRPFRPMR